MTSDGLTDPVRHCRMSDDTTTHTTESPA
jgi:hypothetical protein